MTDDFALEQNSITAMGKYIRSHSLAVWQFKAADEQDTGTAICIEIASRLFIATAAHNFNVIKRGGVVVCFPVNLSSDIPLKIVAHNYGHANTPGVPDLAWLEVDPASATESGLTGIPLEVIEPYHKLQLDGHYTIIGLPAALSEFAMVDNVTEITGSFVFYHTVPTENTNPTDDNLLLSYQKQAIDYDGGVTTLHPGGMSGGGIWYIPPPDDSSVLWSSARNRLVGITTHYFEESHKIRGLRMYHWFELLLADHPELSQHIEPLLNQAS